MQRRSSSSESGYILLAVLFMLVLLLVALAVAAPRIATEIQRDREDELIHRGKQYTHAIKLYYKKFGRYPSSIDQLENTNNIRFLRKRYADPMTGKDDWKIIHFGEAHVKPTGLFGQPISNAGTAGSNVLGGAAGSPSNSFGNTSTFGGTSSFGGSSTLGAGTSSASGSSSSSPTDSSGSSGTSDASGTGGTSSPFSSGTGSGNPTLGGAPMVGVVSKSTKASLKEYKQQKHYNEWEFVYDPVEDMLGSVSLTGGSGNVNGAGTNGTTPGSNGFSGSGSSGTASPFSPGPASGTGTPTNPTSPQ